MRREEEPSSSSQPISSLDELHELASEHLRCWVLDDCFLWKKVMEEILKKMNDSVF